MKVHELIARLSEFDPNSDLVIRDLNGLDWFFEPENLRRDTNGDVLVDTQNINVITF